MDPTTSGDREERDHHPPPSPPSSSTVARTVAATVSLSDIAADPNVALIRDFVKQLSASSSTGQDGARARTHDQEESTQAQGSQGCSTGEEEPRDREDFPDGTQGSSSSSGNSVPNGQDGNQMDCSRLKFQSNDFAATQDDSAADSVLGTSISSLQPCGEVLSVSEEEVLR